MSRPKKMHKPLKGDFNQILGAVAIGKGKGKKAAIELQHDKLTVTAQIKVEKKP